MFTGLIESVQEYKYSERIITFQKTEFWNSTKLGDSICVNGVCLTISFISSDFVTFDLLKEKIKLI